MKSTMASMVHNFKITVCLKMYAISSCIGTCQSYHMKNIHVLTRKITLLSGNFPSICKISYTILLKDAAEDLWTQEKNVM